MNPLPEFISFGEALTDMIRGEGDTWHAKPGGSCWNVARAAARQGLRTGFGGCVSRDCFGHTLTQESEAAGLDLRFLQHADAAPLLAVVHELSPPDYFFIGAAAADLAFDVERFPDGWRDALKWAHFGGISLARPVLGRALLAIAQDLHRRGVKISYDPNYRKLMDEQYDPIFAKMLEIADLVKVSDEDLRGLYRSDDLAAALAQTRRAMDARPLLFTDGGEGATLYIGARNHRCRPPAIRVVDTVGAGDASIAGMVASLCRHEADDWPQHLARAVASGTAACLFAGATPPGAEDVIALLPALSPY
jgi:fructokinase